MAAAVLAALRRIAENPGDAVVRRHRYQAVDAWGVMASGDGEDWVILSQLHPSEPDVILVPYVGPAASSEGICPQPASTCARAKKSAGIGWSSCQVMAIGRLPWWVT